MVFEKPKEKCLNGRLWDFFKLKTECSRFGVHSYFIITPYANNIRSKLQNILHFTNERLGKYINFIIMLNLGYGLG